jgi:hypothetical protein
MKKRKSILIFPDDHTQSPREEFENVGVLWFNQYQDQTSEGEDPTAIICKLCHVNEDACECEFGRQYLLKDQPVQWISKEAADWLVEQCEDVIQHDLESVMSNHAGWLVQQDMPIRLLPTSTTLEQHKELPIFEDEEDRFEVGLDRELVALYVPIEIYEHSGITLRTGQAAETWNEDVRACIYITPEKLQSEFNGDKEMATRCLKGEVETLDMYYRGNVWAFQVYDASGAIVDSCGGIYGDTLEESAIADHLEDDLMPALEAAWDNRFTQAWRQAA